MISGMQPPASYILIPECWCLLGMHLFIDSSPYLFQQKRRVSCELDSATPSNLFGFVDPNSVEYFHYVSVYPLEL